MKSIFSENLKSPFRSDAEEIITSSVSAVLPDAAVMRALAGFQKGSGKVILLAVGKAAWHMASAAVRALGHVDAGLVITKYGHAAGSIPGVQCLEAGHPVPDEHGFQAAEQALALTADLTPDDTVLFLLSGGGSALFEKPLIGEDELQDITGQLFAAGASIIEINTIRKRLSGVKGGRFAEHCLPARVFSIILSDVVGDTVDMIASGPACPDSSTCGQALAIASKYGLHLSKQAEDCLHIETPKTLDNVENHITGSVRELCQAAANAAEKRGYRPVLLTDCMTCEAREAGRLLGSILKTHAGDGEKLAFIAGGETVVHVTGSGKGGRNQELALVAAQEISGIPNAALFSVGSDGTDGPTDAAGGFVDGAALAALQANGLVLSEVLQNNDAYTALKAAGGLITTGPTGTNVNDVAVGLIG